MTTTRLTRNAPKRPSHRRSPSRRRHLGWQGKLILSGFLLIAALLACGVVARMLAPASNTALTRFNAIIVLGSPPDRDGNPTPDLLARVTEGVHEYERGVAPRLIMTGAAVPNQLSEAQVMARTAEAQGIPAAAILMEPEARDTIQNACYSERIMKAHGWRSVEVVSRPSHLPRAAMIFNELPLDWRTHAAPPLEPISAAHLWGASAVEDMKTVRYLFWARWSERCEP
jgi:uncharacterized SAM-binding protein YcdF (DUF218 family)